MGLFNSKKHLLDYFEECAFDRNFLNLHNYLKKFEFIERSKFSNNDRYRKNYDSINYHIKINDRIVRFHCEKVTLKSYSEYFEYYDNNYGSSIDKGYIGLPYPSELSELKSFFPFRVLELGSIVQINEVYQGRKRKRFIDASKKYYLWIDYKKDFGWKDEMLKDFNICSDKLIRETLKNLSKLKKNQ